MYTNTLKTTEF